MIIQVAGILISLGVLVWGTRLSIGAFDALTIKLRLRKLGVAAVLVALSTSLPELFVAVASVAEGVPAVSLGNVLGSNMANLGLVAGAAALIAGGVVVVGDYLKREFGAAMMAIMLPCVLFIDGSLDRVDGLILISAYFVYVWQIVFAGRHFSLAEKSGKRYGIIARLKIMHHNHVEKVLARLLIGLGLVVIAADSLVRITSSLALDLGVSVFLVSFLVLSLGTVMPEFVLALGAIRKGEAALMFGNLLGSLTINSTLILGIPALSSMGVVRVERFYIISAGLLLLFVLFWWFSFSKRRLTRLEGGILFLVYLGLVLAQIFVG